MFIELTLVNFKFKQDLANYELYMMTPAERTDLYDGYTINLVYYNYHKIFSIENGPGDFTFVEAYTKYLEYQPVGLCIVTFDNGSRVLVMGSKELLYKRIEERSISKKRTFWDCLPGGLGGLC